MPQVNSSQLALNQVFPSTDPTDRTLVVRNDLPLRIGQHIFSLVVTDDSGNKSQAATAIVIVLDNAAPTAIVTPPRQTIQFGQDFTLDGSTSTDVGGGRVVQWEWMLVQQPQ
jgi:hypothetical protein